MRIWKFRLTIADIQTVVMPKGAQILCTQAQGVEDEGSIWALCDEHEEAQEERIILMIGTGNPIDFPLGKYIGTFQQYHGKFVWHVFEAPTL